MDEEAQGVPERWWPVASDAGFIWNGWLPRLLSADLRLVNLETSVTEHRDKAPGQAFNFRMHPVNIDVLKAAKYEGNRH